MTQTYACALPIGEDTLSKIRLSNADVNNALEWGWSARWRTTATGRRFVALARVAWGRVQWAMIANGEVSDRPVWFEVV